MGSRDVELLYRVWGVLGKFLGAMYALSLDAEMDGGFQVCVSR